MVPSEQLYAHAVLSRYGDRVKAHYPKQEQRKHIHVHSAKSTEASCAQLHCKAYQAPPFPRSPVHHLPRAGECAGLSSSSIYNSQLVSTAQHLPRFIDINWTCGLTSTMSMNSALSDMAQLILLLFPVPRSIIMCCGILNSHQAPLTKADPDLIRYEELLHGAQRIIQAASMKAAGADVPVASVWARVPNATRAAPLQQGMPHCPLPGMRVCI